VFETHPFWKAVFAARALRALIGLVVLVVAGFAVIRMVGEVSSGNFVPPSTTVTTAAAP
jgi:hypothetical protein